MERNSTSLSREGTQVFFLCRDLGGSIQQEREHNQQDLGQRQHHVALFSAEAYAQADLCFGSEKARETSERLI